MSPDVEKAMQTLRIIVGVLLGGMVALGLVAVLVGSQSPAAPDVAQPLLLVLALFGLAELPAALIVRGSIVSRARRSYEQQPAAEAALVPTIVTLTIITCAMAEAFGTLGLVVFLLTGAGPALIAPAIAFVVLVFQFPTRDRLSRFISRLTGRPWY